MAAVRGRSAGRLLLLVLGVTACLLASSALAQPGEETIAVGEPVPGTTPPGAPVPKREPKPTRPSKPARPPKATGKPGPGRPPAEEGPSVKIAAQLLNATGYDTLLSDNATIATIFVPTDAAFRKLARALNATAVSDLWTVPELLNASMSVLPLHIVPGAALFLANLTAELTAGMPVNLTTLAGPALVLTPGAGNMTMMGGEMEDMMNKEWLATVAVADSNETAAHVIKADMPFQGSVLHIIDAVLLPPGTMLPPGALEGEEGMGGMGEEEEIVMTSAPAAVPAVTAPTVEPGVGGEAVTPGVGEAVTPGAGGETAGPGAETGTPP